MGDRGVSTPCHSSRAHSPPARQDDGRSTETVDRRRLPCRQVFPGPSHAPLREGYGEHLRVFQEPGDAADGAGDAADRTGDVADGAGDAADEAGDAEG